MDSNQVILIRKRAPSWTDSLPSPSEYRESFFLHVKRSVSKKGKEFCVNEKQVKPTRTEPWALCFLLSTSPHIWDNSTFSHWKQGTVSPKPSPAPHMVCLQVGLRGTVRKEQTLSQIPLLPQNFCFRQGAISKSSTLGILAVSLNSEVISKIFSLGVAPLLIQQTLHSWHPEVRWLL